MKAIFGKIWRSVASFPANTAFRISNLQPVAAYINRRYSTVEKDIPCAVALRPHEAVVVEGLTRDGFFISDLASLEIASVDGISILETGTRITEVLARRVADAAHARPAAIIARPGDLLKHPMIYRWGLHPAILRIVGAYLGQPVGYDGPVVFYTKATKMETGTRKWHLDREDHRVVKVALYLHDVDEATGPFQIIPRAPQNTDGRLRYPAMNVAMIERMLSKRLDAAEVITCTGKAGSVIFAETARFFHRGKPPSGHNRAAIFYGYFARSPRNPYFCERSRLSRAQIQLLTKGLSAAQLATALWRDTVPWFVRLVPAYKS